jgi:hypothetical protein
LKFSTSVIGAVLVSSSTRFKKKRRPVRRDDVLPAVEDDVRHGLADVRIEQSDRRARFHCMTRVVDSHRHRDQPPVQRDKKQFPAVRSPAHLSAAANAINCPRRGL